MPASPDDPSQLVSRNGPCPCGSGRRYKDCHGRLPGGDVRLRNVAILNDRGTVLQSQRRYEEALACYDDALALLPDHPDVLGNRGNALLDLRRYEDAAQCFARLVDVAPDHRWALGSLYQARMLCCDWSSIDVLAERIRTAMKEGKVVVTPFTHLVASDSPADQLRSARLEAALYRAPAVSSVSKRSAALGRKIRVAYVSADLRQHPTSTLSAHLFESHDRERFEITAISFGPDTGDPMRRRLERAFDHFLDVRARDDAAIASLISEREIDIAIDLMGYTNNARPGILARRPAPIQVAYLGYPGTMGGDWIDYVLADPQAIPPGEDAHYAERVVRLPDTYFAHDPLQRIGDAPTRLEAGLPDGAVVFCCFNNTYKIAPATFGVWMRVLGQVDRAVLWLLAPNDVARRNLCREAAARGIHPSRLVFAARIPPEQHLARHRLADLFLDTHHYNAHTTAVDALWAGLPVLTFPGTTMAARVACGLLHAAGVPELVARDRGDYETRAVELGRSPEALRALREKLERQRASAPLFDAARHRRAVEAAYGAMWARRAAGLAPAALDIAADGRVTACE